MIDFHVHLGRVKSYSKFLRGAVYASVSDLLEHMNECGVENAVVLPVAKEYPDLGELMKGTNEVLGETSKYSDKLIPFCGVDPLDEGLEAEIKRYVSLGCKGFGEHKVELPVDHERSKKIYDLCGKRARYPVYDQIVDVKSLSRNVEKVMIMADPDIENMIPQKTPSIRMKCPNCTAGKKSDQLTWNVEAPSKLQCRYCKIVFEAYSATPHEKYPANKVLRVTNPLGVEEEYRYYESPTGARFFFECRANYHKKIYFTERALNLAKLYHGTKDIRYARKAAVILARFAEVYPSWTVHGSDDWLDINTVFFHDRKPPYSRTISAQASKWADYWFWSEIPVELVLAYDLIYQSGELEKLSREKGRDVKHDIDAFFRATVDFCHMFGRDLAGIGNMHGEYAKGLLVLGRVIQEPAYVHEACEIFQRVVDEGFFREGMWNEGTPSYHEGIVSGLRAVVDLAKGYSDPLGYCYPATKHRFDNLDLEKECPPFAQVEHGERPLVAPVRTHVHDTGGWWWYLSSPPPVAPDAVFETHLLPGMGHCILGRGVGEEGRQLHLHWCYAHAGHWHADSLNLILFAKGREMICDLGYSGARSMTWRTYASVLHNLVVVDRHNQSPSDKGFFREGTWIESTPSYHEENVRNMEHFGNLLLYEPHHDKVQVVEAEGRDFYQHRRVKTYRRLLAAIATSETDFYVVDIFRVKGGEFHDWALHGDADCEQSAVSNLALQSHQGTLFEFDKMRGEEDDKSYQDVSEIRVCRTNEPWWVDFRYLDGSEIGLRTTMLGNPGVEVVLGRAFSMRRARENDAEAENFTMPIVLARRRGEDLSSTFAAVHEPYRGQPAIDEVKRLTLDPGYEFAVALAVRIGDRTDYILSTTDEPPYPLHRVQGSKHIMFRGRFGIVSTHKGQLTWMYLLDGTELTYGDHALKAPGRLEGDITAVAERGFETNAKLPIDGSLRGATLLLIHGDGSTQGYEIDRVEATAAKTTVVVIGPPGLSIDGERTRMFFFPLREIRGKNRFVITASTYQEF